MLIKPIKTEMRLSDDLTTGWLSSLIYFTPVKYWLPAASLRCNGGAIIIWWRHIEINKTAGAGADGGQTSPHSAQACLFDDIEPWLESDPTSDPNMMRTWCGLEIIFCPFVSKHKTLNLNQGYPHQANIVSSGYSQQVQHNYLNHLVSFRGGEETHFRSEVYN